MCLSLISLIFDEERQINPPAFASLRHPPSTRKGGARLSAFLFPHVCLVRIVQDDDLRRPKAAEWSGSPWGELAPEASEGGGMKNGGLHEFFARHRPESRYPESRTIHIFEDNYSIKVSILSVPDGSLATGTFPACNSGIISLRSGLKYLKMIKEGVEY